MTLTPDQVELVERAEGWMQTTGPDRHEVLENDILPDLLALISSIGEEISAAASASRLEEAERLLDIFIKETDTWKIYRWKTLEEARAFLGRETP